MSMHAKASAHDKVNHNNVIDHDVVADGYIPPIDDSTYEEYTDKHTAKLFTGSIIERLGSFYPKNRKGYTDSYAELRIRKRVAGKIYSKRIQIARSIVSSDFDSKQAVLNAALVANGISPHSVERWDKYVLLLADSEGGWDRFLLNLSREVRDMDYYMRTVVRRILVAIYMCVFIIITNATLSQHYNSTVVGVSSLIILATVMSYASVFIFPDYKEFLTQRQKLMGGRSKDYADMYPASRVI